MYRADHLLTVAFTDTPRKADLQRERQITKFDNLCLLSGLNLLPFTVRESRAKSKRKIWSLNFDRAAGDWYL